MTPDERISCEERAAIMEYDGGLSKSDAERRARKIAMGRGDEAEQMDLIEGRSAANRIRHGSRG